MAPDIMEKPAHQKLSEKFCMASFVVESGEGAPVLVPDIMPAPMNIGSMVRVQPNDATAAPADPKLSTRGGFAITGKKNASKVKMEAIAANTDSHLILASSGPCLEAIIDTIIA